MSIEVVQFSTIVLEDLDIGTGTRQLRLADGSLATCRQLSVGMLALLKTTTVHASNGAATLTLSSFIPAGARILGVTSNVLTAFGITNGLTAFALGDGTVLDRWAAGQPSPKMHSRSKAPLKTAPGPSMPRRRTSRLVPLVGSLMRQGNWK